MSSLENLREFQSLPPETLAFPTQYRYDTVKEFQRKLQELVELYTTKKKRNINVELPR